MLMKPFLKNTLLAALLFTTAALAQSPYDDGQKALREQDWMEAAEQFELAAQTGDEQADAAMYWRAYAFYKANRIKEAERELRRLERKYPESIWIKEAQALRIENQDSEKSAEQLVSGDSGLDEELRLFALSQLMDRDPDRALPLVLDLAHNAESENVRRDALFVLGISETPAARQALAELARNNNDPEAQVNAIHMLGTMEATDELQALYPTLQDRETRIAVIQSLSIAGDSESLKQILAKETDSELRREALFGIAMEDDSETANFLEAAYESAGSHEEKMLIIEALSIMDDATELTLRILRSESDPALQRQAIQVLGIMDATDQLGDLYSSMTDRESRIAVLEAMSIADDSSGLLKVLETEQDEELRANAIQLLAVSGGKEAGAYLLKAYPGASRREKSAVIQSMMIMEDSEGLIGLMKQESDPELKREMMQMLTIIDSEESDQYLFDLLEEKG